jgi:hypothetical protein
MPQNNMTREKLEESGQDPDEQVYMGHTLIRLHEAFDAVKDKTNWKNPIKATIPDNQMAITEAAIAFFTGGLIEKYVKKDATHFTIYSRGYYHYIGS